MNILIINTQTEGGAAKSCLRLFEGLKSKENETIVLKVLATQNNQLYSENLLFDASKTVWNRLSNKFSKLICHLKAKFYSIPNPVAAKKIRISRNKRGLEYYSVPFTQYDITTTESYKNCNIVNLHWVAGLLDYYSFFKKNTKPVVWTLHDMSPLLGGEHYAEWYSGMDEGGEPSLRVFTREEVEMELKITHFKRKVLLNNSLLYFICPSSWLFEEVVQSGICDPKRVFHVSYGINTEVFKPVDALKYRNKLGIAPTSKVLLFVADSLNNRRKGVIYLIQALQAFNEEVTLISVGGGALQSEVLGNIKYISLGRVEDECLMAKIYSSANFFVIPSLMDNLPNTVIESLCCGTPIVGFPVGGIRDMVNDKNGILAKNISVSALEEGISIALNYESNFDRKYIADEARKKYSLNVQAEQYIQIFQKIINDQSN